MRASHSDRGISLFSGVLASVDAAAECTGVPQYRVPFSTPQTSTSRLTSLRTCNTRLIAVLKKSYNDLRP